MTKKTHKDKAPAEGPDRNEALRRMLMRKRDDLVEQTRQEVSKYIKGENRELVENALDDGDWSVVDLSEDLRIKKLATNRDTIIKIEESLRKIDEGSYGKCDDCGDEISAERLKILPFAIRCRDCQETEEEREAAERGESSVYGD